MKKQYLETGKVVNVHGLKGEVKVCPWCDVPELLCEFDTLYIDQGRTPVQVEYARVQKGMVVMKFKEVDTVEQANGWRNRILYLDRNDLQLDDDTYFIQDLIGLKVYDADDDTYYGILSDVLETGANDVYTIKNEGLHKEFLIPAIPQVVISTNIDDGTMKIKPLEEF